jgi:hypothetical protein
MAEKNNYYGSGIFVAGNIDIGAIGKPADSRVMVPNLNGLAELFADKRVYDGMIVYCESTKTYHRCSVEWDSSMNITSSSWKQVEIQSLDELKALIAQESTAAMEFKGTLKDGTLPTLEEGKNYDGNLYKVATKNVTIPAALNAEEEVEVVAKPGDSIVCEGGKWYLIPSGDDVEDTWRAIKVNGVEKLGGGITSGDVDFVQGNNVTITEAGGVITIAAADTHYESKLVAANSATDATDETAEDGQVHLNLVENGEVKSSHKIVGGGGISVTHTVAEGEDGVNVITIEAAEGAKYDLTAKTENDEAILSLTGTDNTEDKVAIVGDDAVAVTVEDGKIKISAHDTTYTGSEGTGVKVEVANGAITATIEDNAVVTNKIADKNVTLAKLEETIQTKLGYIDTEKNVSTAIGEAIEALELADTYVEEEGFENRVQGIKVTNAVNADEATHATNADNAANAVNAQEAVHATNADEATHATNADNATNAVNAQEAVHAVNADEAAHATNADEATHAVNADAATHATAAGKVDTAITVKVGGADVVFDGSEAKTVDVDAAIEAAKVDYTVTCADTDHEATEGAPAFKRHILTQNGKQVCVIDVPRDLVIKSGSVDKEKNELVLVLVNDEEIRVDVSHLIEYVTGGTAADGIITVDVDDNFVATATINDGTITEAKLHKDVTDKLNKVWDAEGAAATAKEEAIAAAAKDAGDKAAVVLGEAQKYADDKVAALAGQGNTTTVAALAGRVNNLETAGHLTEVEADTGLKVVPGTKGANNKVAIDETVVFVLDCNW